MSDDKFGVSLTLVVLDKSLVQCLSVRTVMFIPIKMFLTVYFLIAPVLVCGQYEELFASYKSKTDASTQQRAAEDVITRLLGSTKAQLFNVKVNENISLDGRDTFQITKENSDVKVNITGSNALSVTWGFHYYIKNYCNCHISWDGDQINLPDVLPVVNITKSSVDKFRYYQNACTSSYSFVWWNWTRWEREIDWMALNGINLALAFTAQEAIWQRVYDGLGLARTGFTGPAFLAWYRMGNIRNFGRGLSMNWHRDSVALQHLILNRMRELGIIPVLPAFSGVLPKSFMKKYPTSDLVNLTKWNNFPDEFCCPLLLNYTDPMFPIISRIFLREYILEFGTDHVYNCDTFNENTPPSDDPQYLANAAKAIYDGILQMDPLGIWMIQGWMFIHPFWGKEQVKAYVTSVPSGKMLILDLQADLSPMYDQFESFYGQPFIWCTLHNFGGQLGLYGHLHLVNEGVIKGRNFANSSMVGIGIAPEGIDQNYVMYEFTLDSALRSDVVNLTEWVSFYAQRRYGVFDEHLDQAWFILKETVYNYNPDSDYGNERNKNVYGVHISKNILTKRPSLTMSEMVWYKKSEVFEVLQCFIEASKGPKVFSQLFKHDLVDVTRQVIQLGVGSLYSQLMADYVTNNSEHFQNTSRLFLDILDELDVVLSTDGKYLLGNWISDAKRLAKNANETVHYEFNARNQITLWGIRGEIRDYAAKQWSGMVVDYYKPRWAIFISALNKSLTGNVKYNASAVKNQMFADVELPFSYSHKEYPTEPSGDAVQVINNFIDKWHDLLNAIFSDG